MKHIIKPLLVIFIVCNQYVTAQVSASTPPKDGSWVKIRIVQTAKYLSVENASKENGSRIIQSDYAGKDNQKFQVKKNEDGTYSFFAAHSNKSVCADKGDNREGDYIIQNTLSQYFGKWYLAWLNNCGQGFKIQYKSSSGRPLQVTGANSCQLIEPQYHDGDTDCPYVYLFEPIDAPIPKIEKEKSYLPAKSGVIIKKQQ